MNVRPFVFDRTFDFPVSRAELWKQFEQVEEYPGWWAWLRTFEVTGGGGDGGGEALAEGTVASCVVQGPLPYALNFRVRIVESRPAELVVAEVEGDLEGPARLELEERVEGCAARLVWRVEVRNAGLRAAALVGRPLMQWGHDVVVARGVRQFRERALSDV